MYRVLDHLKFHWGGKCVNHFNFAYIVVSLYYCIKIEGLGGVSVLDHWSPCCIVSVIEGEDDDKEWGSEVFLY